MESPDTSAQGDGISEFPNKDVSTTSLSDVIEAIANPADVSLQPNDKGVEDKLRALEITERVHDHRLSEIMNEGFQETSVGSPGSQFLYEKDAPLELPASNKEGDRSPNEPIRSISSYFARSESVTAVEPQDIRASDFDFLGHASISPEGDDGRGKLKSVSCLMTHGSEGVEAQGKERQSSLSNFFEMESADDTMDAMLAPPEQFATPDIASGVIDTPHAKEKITASHVGSSSPEILEQMTSPGLSSAARVMLLNPAESSFLATESTLHESWIPSEKTKICLVNLNTAPPGTYYPEVDQVTMPGVLLEESLGDPVKELVNRFYGPQEASKRKILNTSAVPQDETGLRQLIAAECYRSAVDLTGRLLINAGQGPGRLGQPSRHTPISLQLWLTRASLLMKLHMFTAAEAELEAFGNFDRADLYYSYYPSETYPNKWGSLVPFGLRVIWAELPTHTGKPQEALDRLFYLQTIVKKMLVNLDAGLNPDGSPTQLSVAGATTAAALWHRRRLRLLYAVANVFCQIKDFGSAVKIYAEIGEEEEEPNRKRTVLSCVGRLLLQLGDIKASQEYFDKVGALVSDESENNITEMMNGAFVSIGKGQFNEALKTFNEILAIEPTNSLAKNNAAVCLIYLGRLREALSMLETLVRNFPEINLQDGVVFNLATLYELESSKATEKKKGILDLVSVTKGDGFNPQCLKMT